MTTTLTPEPATTDEVRPLRTILREFIQNIVDGEDEINQAEIVEQAHHRFEHDDEFIAAALRDIFPTIVPEVLRTVMRDRKSEVVKTPTGYVSKTKLERTARERLGTIFEGTGNGYRSMLVMKKTHLLGLNDRDTQHIDTMTRWVKFRADLAKRMNDTQVVGDLPSSVLETTWNKHLTPKQTD